uniref:Triatin-like salivary lipocalin n=1 Tax=Triatoma dimidiata TaxID=72491 RepID=D1MWC6_TRIDM|nr:hypothetical protein Td22 similar to triatin [Triatoma dimidiata]
MNTIVVVIFFGILTHAFGNFAGITECQQVTAMNGFDPNKFFKGTWHMTNVHNGLFSIVCQDLETEIKKGKLIIEYNYNKSGKEHTVHCESNGQEQNGVIPFNCKIKSLRFFKLLNQVTEFQANFKIMTTDYNDYALLYKCVTLKSGTKADNYVVLRRSKSDYNIPGSVQSFLQINGVSLKNCKELINADDINIEVI